MRRPETIPALRAHKITARNKPSNKSFSIDETCTYILRKYRPQHNSKGITSVRYVRFEENEAAAVENNYFRLTDLTLRIIIKA